MAEVQLQNLEKRYPNDTYAVKGITFAAENGEFVVLVGPSGCGKSTTLRMIAGLEEITGGELSIDGERMNERAPKDRDVAMVFQNYALYPHMTVYENMAFPLRMRKAEPATIDPQVRYAAELLSITHHLSKKPKELSGGERQRVAVGRAIVRKPKVFLFDEPLSNLDAALRTQMRAELKRLQRNLGATMLYVTHDQVEAMTMGDKIAVLNGGLLEQFGAPHDVYEKPATTFVARFLGSPPMNLIEGTTVVHNGGVKFVPKASPGFALQLAGSDMPEFVTVGVRPESVAIGLGEKEGGTDFVRGKLVLIEPIGSVTHYYIEAPFAVGATLIASVGQGAQTILSGLKLGDTVNFVIPASALHLFDTKTGKRI